MTTIPIESDEQWLTLRRKYIGGSEIGALFNMSPWMTRWQLHMTKTGKLPEVDLSDNAAVNAGRHFEGGIAAWSAEKWGMKLRKVRRYFVDDQCEGLGASLDFEAYGEGSGLVPVENKFSIRGHGFDYDGDELTEVPDHYALQLQHQLCATGAPYGYIIAMVDGDLRRVRMDRRDGIISAIRTSVAEFWQTIKDGKEPPVDFTLDGDAIQRLAAINPMCRVDLPAEYEKLCSDYLTAKALEKEHEERAGAIRAEIVKTMLDLAIASGAAVDEQKVECRTGPFKITASMVAANPGTVVTESMIGTTINSRKGYRRISISEPKSKPKKGEAV